MGDDFSRRPLKSRDARWIQRLADALTRAGVAPNAISAFGLAAGIAAGGALVATRWAGGSAGVAVWLLAAGLVQLRLLCNVLDGLVAIEGGRRSKLGPIWNEVPDRISDTAALAGAGFAAGGMPWLGFAAALLAMLTAYIRAIGASNGAGEAFGGIMSKPKRMFVVTAACLAGALGFAPVAMPAALWLVALGSAVTCGQRLGVIARQLTK